MWFGWGEGEGVGEGRDIHHPKVISTPWIAQIFAVLSPLHQHICTLYAVQFLILLKTFTALLHDIYVQNPVCYRIFAKLKKKIFYIMYEPCKFAVNSFSKILSVNSL